MTGLGSTARYDEIADWYARYAAHPDNAFSRRADAALRRALGRGQGVCWDAACGTGLFAGTLRDLGWTPVGTDLSTGQARHAAAHLPVAVGDATRAPVRSGSVRAVASVVCHTDLDDYPALCREAARALAPGGVFAHVGVHPCFIGAFADRSDERRIVLTAGYWRRERTFESWNTAGVRARVGATHLPVGELVTAVAAAGLVVDEVIEVGEPTPDVLAIRARRPAGPPA